jgi:UrcA family protein
MNYWKEYMMKTPLKIIVPAVAMMALAIAAPASAGEVSATVQYSDLNLTTATGQKMLKKRIDNAVSRICQTRGKVSLQETMASRKCHSEAAVNAGKAANVVIARAENGSQVASTSSPAIVGN